jgi:uncharacterized protein YfaS (alpha-2-macroglobulin family)
MPGTNTAVLEVSGIPPINAGRWMKYLIGYPHGCVEQVTSKAFAQLFLPEILELDENTKLAIDNNVKAGIKKLQTFLQAGGGFSYWPGQPQVDVWCNSYAGHFLLEAEKKGYTLPAGLKASWLRSQKQMARQWVPNANHNTYQQYDLEQAYRLYTLALAGEPEMSAMNRLRENTALSLQAKWRLAAAYALAGQTNIAKEIINRESTEIQQYNGFYSSYGSRERDWAMILETLTILNENNRGLILTKKISEALSSGNWMSTQTTAYCLVAVAKFTKGKTSGKLTFNYRLNNDKAVTITSSKPVVQLELPIGKNAVSGKVTVNNLGGNEIFTRVIMEGIPETGNESEFSNNLDLKTSFLSSDGKPLDISKLSQGTDFMVVVSVYNPGGYNYRDLALTQVFPPGWEILSGRLEEGTSGNGETTASYRDFRDDRIYTYFDIKAGEKKTYTAKLSATYLGRYYLAGTYCEAMYDNTVSAMRKGQWVEVTIGGR